MRSRPTPAVGCVGLVADVRALPGAWREGDVVLLAGGGAIALDGSEYQTLVGGGPAGRPPAPDYVAEAALVRFLWRSAPVLSAAHDVSDGGLAVALAELALHSGIGARVELDDDVLEWFGEGAGRAVVACAPERAESLEGAALRRAGSRRRRQAARRLPGRPARRVRSALMCGVVGIHAPDRDVARLSYFGLFALQHRGQESAGIAVSDESRLTALRDMGLVTQVFSRAEAARPPRADGDRPLPLLDDRLDALDERAADRPARPGAHGRARAQRQPHEHGARSAPSCSRAAPGSRPPRTPR